MAAPVPSERLVVVSPHLDDGVLSLGAALHAWARAGRRVALVTALGGDPASEIAAGGWDTRGGFATEGEAARARRVEDERACALLGVEPVHLGFGYQDYERHGDEAAVRAALAGALAGASEVLLPASPLTHPDHEWVVRLALDLPAGRVGFYLEQPYGTRSGGERVPEWLGRELKVELSFADAPGGLRDRLAKWRAVQAYASQLPLLALTGRRALRLALQPERVAWLDRGPH